MVQAIDDFAGITGNASQVGGAGSVVLNTGGGLLSQIYGRSLVEKVSGSVAKRAAYNASNPYDYTWAGHPVSLGMPMPGTYTGFPGTLSGVRVPAAATLVLGLIWIMVALAGVAASILITKGALEVLSRLKWIKEDRLAYFRSHWAKYLRLAMLRAFFMALFAVMFLAIFQLAIGGSTGTIAVAVLALASFLGGAILLVSFACRARTRYGKFETRPDRIIFHPSKLFRAIPVLIPTWDSTLREHQLEVRAVFSITVPHIRHVNDDPDRPNVHQDQEYIRNNGWLSGRYRRSRWWFLAFYTGYLAIRAAFLGGAVRHPLVQIYGLLIFEILAFAVMVVLSPFEGARNTSLAVWMLSINKITTTGLSIAFLPAFKLDRIIATVIGVIIIVIQGLLVVALMILVVLSCISTWMSLSRNREELGAEHMESTRVRYFEVMEAKAADALRPRPIKKNKGKDKEEGFTSREPYFSVVSVRREPKIEDEDGDIIDDLDSSQDEVADLNSPAFKESVRVSTRASRANSTGSRFSTNNVTRGTRDHPGSWSSRDFAQIDAAFDPPDKSILAQRLSHTNSPVDPAANTTPSPTPPRSNSRQSLRKISETRPASPFTPGLNTPSRETLQRYAEERRYPTPKPAVPNLD